METTETRWQRHVEAGRRYVSQGDYVLAEQALLAAVKEALTLGPADLRVAASLGILGKLKQRQGKREQAEALLRRALAVREQALGANHYGVMQSINDLAAFYYAYGQLDAAAALYERALDIADRQLAPDHDDVALALYNLARVHFKSGDHLRAEPLLVRLLALKEQTLGAEHADVAAILMALARVRSIAGHHDEGEQMARRALAIRERTLAPTDPAIAISLDLVAYFCAGRAKREQLAADAERILRGGDQAPSAPALDATLQALAGEERALRDRARAIRALHAEPTEPATLERTPPAPASAASHAPDAPPAAAAIVSEVAPAHEDTPIHEPQVSDEPTVESRPINTALAVVPRRVSAPRPPRSVLSILARAPRLPAAIAAAVVTLFAAGWIGAAIGRHQRAPVDRTSSGSLDVAAPTQAAPQSAAVVAPPVESHSLTQAALADARRTSERAEHTARPAPVPVRVAKPAPPPGGRELSDLNRLIERAGARVAHGATSRADSIGRSVNLRPPSFGHP